MLSEETNWEVCDEAKNGEEAVRKTQELKPDLILMDVSMPVLGGLEAARLLHQLAPNVKILIMSHHDPVRMLPGALEAGAHACIDKSELATDLVGAIKRVIHVYPTAPEGQLGEVIAAGSAGPSTAPTFTTLSLTPESKR